MPPIRKGNVEESLGFAIDDCQCGFEEGSTCDLLAAQWYRYGSEVVSDDIKAWMRTLPRRIDFTFSGARFAVIHGGVQEINRFVFPATAPDDIQAELDKAGTQAVIGGHSGLPFSRVIDGRLWHNPGVIGLPANDGTPRVWYSLLRSSEAGITVETRALRYDHDSAAKAIRKADLPNDYADALESGLWPSDEIMPAEDRRRRGAALLPSRLVWHPPAPVPAAAE
jgi:diadenosine tetraphosphatase ApaH/serine/threonine PP2A family protein phosphatase